MPQEARLPAIHSRHLVHVLERFANGDTLSSLPDYKSTDMWNETRSERDGVIRSETTFPSKATDLVLSGPHFFVANPFYKTPRQVCTHNSHYDVLDLTELPENYLPRTNFLPACSAAEYRAKMPRVPWGMKEGTPVADLFRIVVPNMISQGGERTHKPAIIPPGPAHVHTVNSYAFQSHRDLLRCAVFWVSILGDFYVKSTGVGHFQLRHPLRSHQSYARRSPGRRGAHGGR